MKKSLCRTGFISLPLLLAASLIAAPASAQSAADKKTLPQRSGEIFVVNLPDPTNWKMGSQTEEKNKLMVEYVPKHQSMDAWQEMIASYVFFGVQNAPADVFLARLLDKMNAVCESGRHEKVAAANELGNAAARSVHFCPKSLVSGDGEVTFLKALQGRDNFYIVQRVWRGTPFAQHAQAFTPQKTAEWQRYLDSVVVCDNLDPARACPTGAAK